MSTRKRIAYSVGPTSAVAGVGLLLHWQAPDAATAVAIGEGLLALACGATAIEKNKPKAWPVCIAAGLASVPTGFGWSWASFYSWIVASGLAFAARLYFEHTEVDKHVDRKIKHTRLEIAKIHHEKALQRLSATAVATGPVLEGSSPEETALRLAFWGAFKKELAGVLVSPLEGGWRADLTLPADLSRQRVEKEWDRVFSGLGATGKCTLEAGRASNALTVRYTEGDILSGLVPYVPVSSSDVDQPVWLGPTETGSDIFVDLVEKHVLILGTSGNGKSNLINLLILHLVRTGAAVIGIDMKRGVELAPVKPLLVTLATDGNEAREVFDWLESELDRRAGIMTREGVRNWSEDLGPFVWLIIDELAEMTLKKWRVQGLDNLEELVESAVRTWRAFGIHVVGCTQAPSRHVFGNRTDARTNYKVRISTRLEEAAHAQFAFGPNWKAKGWDPNGRLLGAGEFLISSEENVRPVRAKAPRVDNDTLAREVQRLLPYKVRLEGSPWGEGGVALSVDTRVLNLFKHRAGLTRGDVEKALGLTSQQVRDAIKRLRSRKGVEISYDDQSGTYSLAAGGHELLAAFTERLPGRSEG